MNQQWRRPKPLIPVFPGLYDTPDIHRWLRLNVASLNDEQHQFLEHAIRLTQRKGARSEDTYRGFRNELERFLLYCFAHDLSPAEMRPGDITRYIKFCQKPPVQWVMTEHHHRFDPDDRPNEKWRPFYMPSDLVPEKAVSVKRSQVSQSMINRQYSFLNQWYKDLIDYELVRKNPIPIAKAESPFLINDTDQRDPKSFNTEEWVEMMRILLSLANAEPKKWDRALFLILLMKTCYLRIGDLASKPYHIPTMSDFYRDQGYLFLYVMSKRKKSRSVTVPKAMEPFIVRYRQTRGLDGLPLPGEEHPLISKDRGTGNIGTRQLNRIVQEAFEAITAGLATIVDEKKRVLDAEVNPEARSEKANVYEKWRSFHARMERATPHCLRHTGASIDALWRPLPELAEELGHADPGTTGRIYVHSSRVDRAISGAERTLAGPPETA